MVKSRLALVLALMIPAVAILCLPSKPALADGLAWATGQVLNADRQPIPDATVVLYDDKDHVVDYSRTDQDGEYALAVPVGLLHLPSHHGKGFISSVFTGVTRFVGTTAGFVANPIRAGVRAVTGAEAALNPDIISKGEIEAGGAVADRLLFGAEPRARKKAIVQERQMPGSLFLKVVAPDASDMVAVDQLYWIQHEIPTRGEKHPPEFSVWLDPVRMEPDSAVKPSQPRHKWLCFKDPRAEPGVVERGEVARLQVSLPAPPQPATPVIVVAKDARTGKIYQLVQTEGNTYEADIHFDRRAPLDDHLFAVVAYAQQPSKPGRRKNVEGAIDHAKLFDPKVPYLYDPLLVASRDRAIIDVTVVDPRSYRRP
ncbi:MAG: carboxypeptidase regulatory-like domain-containing protein [Armatimonadetes bacterium]|nr:carboxypeptidase regulatory-like domain-containing protein [Armatimonadota bacterium]MDE2207019.1 carboxypeptidase regulatory-like domain-containing protein [Armatimonadota bacterium]